MVVSVKPPGSDGSAVDRGDPVPNQVLGEFIPTRSRMSMSRYDAMSVKLPNGKVLIAGGAQHEGTSPPFAFENVDLFDPVSNRFIPMNPLLGGRSAGAVTLLGDGRILFIGGNNLAFRPAPTAEIYDPSNDGQSEELDVPPDASRWNLIQALADGRVLLVGSDENHREAATLNPETGAITQLEPMPVPVYHQELNVSPDGRVFIYGSQDSEFDPQLQTVVFDPASNVFSLGPTQEVPRFDPTVTALSDGRVLISGGRDSSGYIKSAEILDPLNNRADMTGMPIFRRVEGLGTQLSDGRVLVTGGRGLGKRGDLRKPAALYVSEIFDPTTGQFTRTGDLTRTRPDGLIEALPAGRALLAGGNYFDIPTTFGRNSAEVFEPSEFNATLRILKVRPRIRSVRIGERFEVKLLIRNLGQGIARSISVCLKGSFGVFWNVSCPVVPTLAPRDSKWFTFQARVTASRARGKTVGLPLTVRSLGKELQTKVLVKVK